jgi:hypothetical protein
LPIPIPLNLAIRIRAQLYSHAASGITNKAAFRRCSCTGRAHDSGSIVRKRRPEAAVFVFL